MKAVTTITLTKDIPDELIPTVKNITKNDPKQIKDAEALIKAAMEELFATNGEEVKVKFKYIE